MELLKILKFVELVTLLTWQAYFHQSQGHRHIPYLLYRKYGPEQT